MADVVPSIEALAMRKCDCLGEGVERSKRAFGPALPVYPKRLGRNAIPSDRRVHFFKPYSSLLAFNWSAAMVPPGPDLSVARQVGRHW
jgi:hypothetical protein